MNKYPTIQINNKEYFWANDIYDFDNSFFYGCRNNIRNIVDKKNISEKDHIFAYNKDDSLVISNIKYNKAKLYLSKGWCIDNVPKLCDNSKAVVEYEKLPPKVELDDNQKFIDNDGNGYNITMRGERSYDKCYFKVDDISEIFEMKNIAEWIGDERSTYEKNIDYKIFIFEKSGGTGKIKNKICKTKYFTYKGLIKCLYISKSIKAHKFQDWANKILFTHQFGNLEEKQELSSKLLGVHAKTIKEVFSTSSTDVPCVYLFTLGTAKDLRNSMKLDSKYSDDMIICKYGMTDSLSRRAPEHNKTYGSIKNVNLHLKYYAYIDQQYISNAESDISDYFDAIGCKIEYEKHKELVALEPNKLNKLVKQQYTNLSTMYAGHIKDLIKKINDLENKLILQEEKHKNEIQAEKHKNEIQIDKHKNELQAEKHKNEIEKHKNEILQNDLKNQKELNEKDKLILQMQVKMLQNGIKLDI